MNAPWRIELFGGLQLFGDNGVVLNRFQTRKTGALLGYLAYYKEKPVSREVLADLFWPENEPEAARNSLRVALNSLRKQLEPPGIPPGGVLSADRAAVRLNPQAVVTDTAEFERALKAERNAPSDEEKTAHLLRAVEHYKGPLLSGWYEEWIDGEQNRLGEVYGGALRRLTGLLFASRDFDRALEFAQKAVQSDPLREENHHSLMRLYASLGRPDAALKAFRELESLLHDEMNAPPSGATRDLVKQIVALSSVSAASSASAQNNGMRGDLTPFIGDTADLPATVATEAVFAPAAAAAAEPFAPLPAAPASEAVGSVPLQWTRFWGREKEIARLLGLLQPASSDCSGSFPAPLVTLSGPGGVGKTRLAVEVAARLRRTDYAGRVWFVPLDEETPPVDALWDIDGHKANLLRAVVRVLRLPLENGSFETVLTNVVGALGGGSVCDPVLLVLDNVPASDEGIVATAHVLARLREAVPGLRCLATSRRRLDLGSERELVLEPLPVPVLPPSTASLAAAAAAAPAGTALAPAHLLEALSACPSVAFFVERAQTVRPDFQITPRNAFAIADLCQRLDGLPLALELAAAWSRLLTPAQMVERTRENGFALLSTERRDLAVRHRSLQTVLTEACDELPPPLRAFFAAVSVFDGGWTLHAAEAVCGKQGEAARDVLPLLDALQARSLVCAYETDHSGGLRFRLLQTTRCFVQTLLSSVDRARLKNAHAEYYSKLAQAAQPFLGGSAAQAWRERLAGDEENLRAVLRAACDPDAAPPVVERGLQTASCLWRYWYARGQCDEGAQWLQTLLHHPAGAVQTGTVQTAPLGRARALHGAGRLLLNTGQATQAGVLFNECLQLISQAENETRNAADAPLPALNKTLLATDGAIAARARGDAEAVRDALALVLHEKQADGDAWGTASALSEWGSDALLRGDVCAAQDAFVQSARLRRALGDRWGAAEADLGQAQSLVALGETGRANPLKQRADREMAALGDVHGIAASFLNLGYVAAEQDDWEAAQPLLRDAVSLFQTRGDHRAAALVLWLIARAADRQNETLLVISAAEDALSQSQAEGDWVSASVAAAEAGQFVQKRGAGFLLDSAFETRISVLAARLLERVTSRQKQPNGHAPAAAAV